MEWKTIEFENLYAESSRNGLYKSKEFHGTGIRIVNMKEMFAFPLIGEQEMQLLELNDNELNKFGLKTGDLLFARRSLVEEGSGKCVLVVEHKNPIVFESSIIRVRLKKDECFPLFYYYYFRSPIGRLGIKSIITGAGQKGIRGSELAKVLIYHLPLPEQKTIAQSLSDVDALITECDRIITKKRNAKQGTMQQLLTGKKRLPGFSGEWEVEEFEQVLKVVDGDRGDNYPSNDELFDNGYCLFLSAKNVTKGGFKFSDCTFITKEKDNLLGNGKVCKKDVVLTTRGTVGNIAFFDDSVPFENIRINSGMVILRSEEKNLDNSYLYSFLKSHIFQTQIDRAVFGSAQPQLTVKGISKFKIPVSSLPEQKAIAQVLSDMDAEIAALEQKRDKHKAIKQGMMQELLTGKTRLKVEGEENDPD